MQFEFLLEQVVNGLVLGGYYLLIALGLSLIFSVGGIVNLAHGAFYALGAYTFVELSRHLGFGASVAISPIAVALLGILFERFILRRFYTADPILSLLVTFGLAMVADQHSRHHPQDQQAITREQEIADDDRAAKGLRDFGRQRSGAPDHADRLLGDHRKPEGHEQAEDWVGVIEPAQDEALEENAEEGNGNRRDHHRGTEAEMFGDLDGGIGAERIERAMGEVDDAADREDQRQPECDQKIIASEHEAIHHLFEQESELHAA